MSAAPLPVQCRLCLYNVGGCGARKGSGKHPSGVGAFEAATTPRGAPTPGRHGCANLGACDPPKSALPSSDMPPAVDRDAPRVHLQEVQQAAADVLHIVHPEVVEAVLYLSAWAQESKPGEHASHPVDLGAV